jgi:hypothetical protein
MRMLTASSRAEARRKRAFSKPSMPNALTTRKPEIVSCRISEMSFQRRSDVSFEARSLRPRRSSGSITSGSPTSDSVASRQSM